MWIESPECFVVIKNAWGEREVRQPDRSMEPKLINCRKHLIKWSRKTFRYNWVDIQKAKERLWCLSQTKSTAKTQREEDRLKDRITTLLKREEIYWKQRSRVNWLRNDNRNSTFFQVTTSARRRRNNILRLLEEQGDWITSEVDIMIEVCDYFENMFSWDQPVWNEDHPGCIPTQVSAEMRIKIERYVSDDEIKATRFQLRGR